MQRRPPVGREPGQRHGQRRSTRPTTRSSPRSPSEPAPRALAFAPNGDVWVTNRGSAQHHRAGSRDAQRRPHDRPAVRVAAVRHRLCARRQRGVRRARGRRPGPEARSRHGREIGGANVGATPRHLSLNADGTRLYVVALHHAAPARRGHRQRRDPDRSQSTTAAKCWCSIPATHGHDQRRRAAPQRRPGLREPGQRHPELPRAGRRSRRTASSAWVPSKKDNVKRGTLRSGGNLNFQNTVRAISSRIDLATNTESFGARIDHDNASLASAAAFDRYGVFMFVALETSREVAVVNAHDHAEFFRINVGRAPQGRRRLGGRLSAVRQQLHGSHGRRLRPDAAHRRGPVERAADRDAAVRRDREAESDGAAGQAAVLRRARHAARPRGVHELRELPQRRRQRRTRLGPHRHGRGLRNTVSLRGKGGMGARLPALERQLRRGAGLRGPDPRARRRHGSDVRRGVQPGHAQPAAGRSEGGPERGSGCAGGLRRVARTRSRRARIEMPTAR